MGRVVSIAGVDEQFLGGPNSFEFLHRNVDLRTAASELTSILKDAVGKRIDGTSAIAFSGGLDSSLIVKLAEEPAPLFAVGLENSYDLSNAKRTASVLRRGVEQIVIEGRDVEYVRKEVQEIIGTSDALQTEIAIPFYFIGKVLKERGFTNIVSGQGADELFAGYKRYEDSIALESDLVDDIVNIYENNLKRDLAVAKHFGIEMRLPFLDREVIQFALSLPNEYKLANNQRKVILREVGKSLGLSPLVYNQPKKAIQYGTGVAGVLKAIPKC